MIFVYINNNFINSDNLLRFSASLI